MTDTPTPTGPALGVVLLGQLVPGVLVVAGLLTYEGLLLTYTIECLVLLVLNLVRATRAPDRGRSNGLLVAAMSRGAPVVLGLLLAWLVLEAEPQDVALAVVTAGLVVANLLAAGRRSGLGVLDAAGDPTGSWWRMALLAGGVVSLFFTSSVHDMAERGLDGADSFHGVGGTLAGAIVSTASATGLPVASVVALLLVAWKAVDETLFEAWSRAPR